MKRLFLGIGIILALSFVTVFIIQNFTKAQPPGPPEGEGIPGSRMPRQNFGAMMAQALSLPASWWHISVELEIDDEQLIKARPIYRESWKKEQDLRQERPQNREEMLARIEKIKAINAELKEKLEEILTEEQFAKYEEWEKERQERFRRTMERQRNRPQRLR